MTRDVDRETLFGMSRDELITLWRKHHRRDPPKGSSRTLLARAIAHASQVKRYGGLSAKTRRQLDQIARSGTIAQAQPQNAPRPGARLVRTWKGVNHVVDVVENGFLWNGEHHRSLSAIAKAITGARWSGPRFFGIKG